jgi:hypothetical protein
VGDLAPLRLDVFESSESGHENQFVQALELEAPPSETGLTFPESLASEPFSGDVYATGARTANGFVTPSVEVWAPSGASVERFGPFEGAAHLAFDQSSDNLADPSACGTLPLSVSECFLYVAHQGAGAPAGDGQLAGVEKLDARGGPVAFSSGAPYIEGNEIIGTPPPSAGGCEEGAGSIGKGRFAEGEPGPGDVAVDSSGDIFVVDGECAVSAIERVHAILEYGPSGGFLRRITGRETPGLAGSVDDGGFGGTPQGLAFDPTSGDLLVSIVQRNSGGTVVAGAVDEFDTRSGRYVNQITAAGQYGLLQPIQMTVDSHGYLYVSELQRHAVEVYGPGHFLPSVRLAEPSERRRTSVVLDGAVNPHGRLLGGCRFQWVRETAFDASGFADLSSGGEAQCAPSAGAIPADEQFHVVSGEASGLESGVTYRYRLLATSEGALGGTEASAPLAFTAPHAPRVDSSFVGESVSSTLAELHAQIGPLGAPSSYRFEYDTTPYVEGGEAHGVSVPIPDAAIGSGGESGNTEVSVVQQVTGLRPATTYHFRVVASGLIEGHLEATRGPDVSFTTLAAPTPGLPDHRAYELLTPAAKGSAKDMFDRFRAEGEEYTNFDRGVPARTGDGFLLETEAAFAPSSASYVNAYTFSRTPGGWGFASLAAPGLGVQSIDSGAEIGHGPLFDPADLTSVAFNDEVGSRAGEEGERAMNLVGAPGGPYATVHSDMPVHEEEGSENTKLVGASRDLSRVFLASSSHLLAAGDSGQDEHSKALYEWSGGGECAVGSTNCRLVNVNSAGTLLNHCGARIGQGSGTPSGQMEGTADNAVSSDGSKVFFTAPDPNARNEGRGCWNGASVNAPQLYMRTAGATTRISKPAEAGVPDPCAVAEDTPSAECFPAAYVGASEDGTRVFFLTRTELTRDDAGIHDLELYEYDSGSGTLTRISHGQSGRSTANVSGVKAISADGGGLYFEASGRLTSTAPAELPEGQVYVYRYGLDPEGKPETSYVAMAFSDEAPNGEASSWVPGGVIAAPVPHASWYATPNGRYLLFATASPVTRDGTAGRCPAPPDTQVGHSGPCEELYRYDASEPLSRGLGGAPQNPVCISCNPSGAAPRSHALFTRSNLFGGTSSALRGLSDDGSYAFFDTADALVPQDTNGTLDVYEWEAHGIGGCELEQGCVHLISSGKDAAPSFFLGASPDGANVFVGTHARLVPQDTDIAGDLYDARICTAAEPCIRPPSAGTARCEGDSCQSVPVTPDYVAPSTQTLPAGAGNLTPPASPPRAKPKIPTRAQLLAKALKACHTKHNRHKRLACEKQAHQRYRSRSSKGRK